MDCDVDLLATHLGEFRSPGDERERGAILDDGDASGWKRDIARVPASDPHALGHRPVDLVEFSLKPPAERCPTSLIQRVERVCLGRDTTGRVAIGMALVDEPLSARPKRGRQFGAELSFSHRGYFVVDDGFVEPRG